MNNTHERTHEHMNTIRESLLNHLKPGDTLFLLTKHKTRTGLRYIQTLSITISEGKPVSAAYLTWNIANLLGRKFNDEHEAIAQTWYTAEFIKKLSTALFDDPQALRYYEL